ncbi:MAG: M16 family metallopeptidase, partial [Planctomycetota bacterium]
MRERFYIETFENGLTLLAQPVRQVSSAAMTISVSAGAAADPPGAEGAAAVAGKWLLRGAGDMDTRRLHDALDNLGCRHSERVQSEFLTLTAASLGRHLPKLIGLYAQILQQPRLGDDTFEPCRQWTAQELESLEDEPSRKANMLLRQRFYPEPFGRCVYGSEKSLAALSAESVRKHIKGRIAPGSTIVAVAGNVEFEPLLEWVSQAFGPWQAPKPEAVKPGRIQNGRTHIRKDSAQTHITLAHPAAGLDDPEYYRARIVQMVLSGGMASRLFTEVREKRGLVYHVSTRYHAIQHRAGMFTYAGCEPDKAQETFDVTVGELKRLAEGIE